MSLREKYGAVTPDKLADLAMLFDETDKLEADLNSANSIIGEKDKKIAELQEQSNRLYARLFLNTGAEGKEEEEEKEETLDEFNERIREMIIGE